MGASACCLDVGLDAGLCRQAWLLHCAAALQSTKDAGAVLLRIPLHSYELHGCICGNPESNAASLITKHQNLPAASPSCTASHVCALLQATG